MYIYQMFTSPPNISEHSKYNKHIDIKIAKPKGLAGLFRSSTNQPVFRVPPLNAVIESKYGTPPQPKKFKGFQSGVTNTKDLEFLSWIAVNKKSPGDPNKYRTIPLNNYSILEPLNQDCCGACWAVSSATAFSDRYGIANDEKPIMPSIISIMSCCTKNKHKNIFRMVDTPDCDVMSTYDELASSPNSMGMCSGGIPYSAGLTIYRNGLPSDQDTIYDAKLFKCGEIPSFPHMNKALIDKYSCNQQMYDTDVKIRMDTTEKPVYISAHEGHPTSYVELMKKALLDGPLVGGYMVLGDQLAIGTDALGLGIKGNSDKPFNWDTTGKVYVPGAYNEEWGHVVLSSVGGSTTLEINSTNPDEPTLVTDKGLKPKEFLGNISCGFHAVVIVGWGELDMDYVTQKNVKTVTGKDGRPKLPFWIMRNSWGAAWPINNYYEGGIKVRCEGKEQMLDVPPGYWLHAMYPNESMGIDVPINYEGTYYGATMEMIALKKSNETPSSSLPGDTSVGSANGDTSVGSANLCNTTWTDSEGYTCKQYGDYKWCTSQGGLGNGWNKDWGNFSRFKNVDPSSSKEYDASEICCECKETDIQRASYNNTTSTSNMIDTIVVVILILALVILIAMTIMSIRQGRSV